jgi:hypothetical protein
MDGFIWWLRDYGKSLLVAAVLFALSGGMLAYFYGFMNRAPVYEEGTILRFGSYSARRAPGALVVVQTGDGMIRQLAVDERRTRRCKVGDRIHIARRGPITTVRPQGCVDLPKDGKYDPTL